MKTQEKILATIQALLSKTQANGASEAEAALAAGRAAELMAKHGIEARLAEPQQSSEVTHDKIGMPSKDPNVIKWQRILGATVASICFCKTVYSSEEGKLTFIGTKGELEVAKGLYAWLGMQVTFISSIECQGKDRKYFGDFTYGMVIRITNRLKGKFENEVECHDKGVSLVKASDTMNTHYALELFPNLRTVKLAREAKGEGYQAGYKKGEDVNLNSGALPSGPAAHKTLPQMRKALA